MQPIESKKLGETTMLLNDKGPSLMVNITIAICSEEVAN